MNSVRNRIQKEHRFYSEKADFRDSGTLLYKESANIIQKEV